MAIKIGELEVGTTVDTGGLKRGKEDIEKDITAIEARLLKMRQMGKSNVPWFKEEEAQLKRLQFELDKTSPKVELFRNKRLNLARDGATITAASQQTVGALIDISKQLQSTSADFGTIAASSGNATLSLLYMVPQLKAIKDLLPAAFLSGASAAGVFALKAAIVIASIYAIVEGIKRIDQVVKTGTAGEEFEKSYKESFIGVQKEIITTEQLVLQLGRAFIWLKGQIQNALDINRTKIINSVTGFADTYSKLQSGEMIATDQLRASIQQLNKAREKSTDKDFLEKSGKVLDELQKRLKIQDGIGRVQLSTGNRQVEKLKEEEEAVKNVAIGYKKYERAMIALKNVIDVFSLSPKTLDPVSPAILPRGQEKGPEVTFEKIVTLATDAHNILNRPLEGPLSMFQRMLEIATKIAVMLNLTQAASFLGPLGGIFGILGSLFDEGGYTGGSDPKRAAGVVHEGEHVSPNWMVKSMPQLYSWIESVRRTRSVTNIPGYFNGGFARQIGGGGGGMIVIQAQGELTDALTFRIINKQTRITKTRIERPKF